MGLNLKYVSTVCYVYMGLNPKYVWTRTAC